MEDVEETQQFSEKMDDPEANGAILLRSASTCLEGRDSFAFEPPAASLANVCAYRGKGRVVGGKPHAGCYQTLLSASESHLYRAQKEHFLRHWAR